MSEEMAQPRLLAPGGDSRGAWQSAISAAVFGRAPSFQPNSPELARARRRWERSANLPSARTIIWSAVVLGFLYWAWTGIDAAPLATLRDLPDSWRIVKQFFSPDWSILRPRVDATIVTVQMAVIGILVAAVVSIPIGLLAARNVANRYVYYVVRTFLSLMRCIPELVWAIVFVVVVGLGPWAGTLAIILGTTGSFGKLFAESIEAIDPRPVDAVRATGASPAAVSRFAVIPQAFPMLFSYVLYYWESTVRHATILGLVGAGGIGVFIQADTGALRYDRLATDIVCIFVAVLIIDRVSALLRARLL